MWRLTEANVPLRRVTGEAMSADRSEMIPVILPTGRTKHVRQKEALRMIVNGEVDLVSRDPLTLRVIHTPVFAEERQYLTGVRIYGAPRKKSYGGWGNRPWIRTRAPRPAHVITEAEFECRKSKEEWLQRRGYRAGSLCVTSAPFAPLAVKALEPLSRRGRRVSAMPTRSPKP